MAPERRRNEVEGRQAMREAPEDVRRAGDAVQGHDRPPRGGTELLHVEPHAAMMGQRRGAGR